MKYAWSCLFLPSDTACSLSLQDKIKARIADSSGQGPAGEKRKQLRAEQAEIRSKTAGFKEGRNSAFNQIKALQESVAKKIKDVNTSKSKTNYKSVEEIGKLLEILSVKPRAQRVY